MIEAFGLRMIPRPECMGSSTVQALKMPTTCSRWHPASKKHLHAQDTLCHSPRHCSFCHCAAMNQASSDTLLVATSSGLSTRQPVKQLAQTGLQPMAAPAQLISCCYYKATDCFISGQLRRLGTTSFSYFPSVSIWGSSPRMLYF